MLLITNRQFSTEIQEEMSAKNGEHVDEQKQTLTP